MSVPERVYDALLRAYPKSFRAEFARHMRQAFRDRLREARGDGSRFWWAIVSDIARSAPGLRFDDVRERTAAAVNLREATMKTMAILSMLVGALETVNSAAEGWVGGVLLHGGSSLVSGMLGALAGGMLVAAAIAMLRRTPRATAFAQAAAIACLAVFGTVALVSPVFSVLATLLGVAFPIALLVYFRVSGPAAPRVA